MTPYVRKEEEETKSRSSSDDLAKNLTNYSATTTTSANSENNEMEKPVQFSNNSLLTPLDVISFLNYCHVWQQK